MAGNDLRYATYILTNIPRTVSRHEFALYVSEFDRKSDAFAEFDEQIGQRKDLIV